MTSSANEEGLEIVLSRHGLEFPAAQIVQLDHYRRLLWNRNQCLNLTRHLDLETFVTRDVLDSLQLAQQLEQGERVLDVGTGGGVPGIILGIIRPDLRVSVCESVGKRAAAVADMVRELTLPIPVLEGRVQELLATRSFDTLVARAVGPLWKVLKWLQPHWSSFGRLLLIKGPKWTEERGEARHRGYLTSLQLRRLASYTTPGHYGQSVVLGVYPPSASSDSLASPSSSDAAGAW